jgi:hypothetical protein
MFILACGANFIEIYQALPCVLEKQEKWTSRQTAAAIKQYIPMLLQKLVPNISLRIM